MRKDGMEIFACDSDMVWMLACRTNRSRNSNTLIGSLIEKRWSVRGIYILFMKSRSSPVESDDLILYVSSNLYVRF